MIVAGLVRNLANPVPAGMPVRLKLFNPRGSLVQETQHTLSAQGSFETSVPDILVRRNRGLPV